MSALALRTRRESWLSSPKIARAETAPAGSVRTCSSFPFPLILYFFFSSDLTPARWDAMNLGRHFSPCHGLGKAVPEGTSGNRNGNRQVVEIVAQFVRFPWFPQKASRDARARMCGSARASRTRENEGTKGTNEFIYLNHIDTGSLSGSRWFPREPVEGRGAESPRKPPFLDKIEAGYAGKGVDRRSMGRLRARPGEKFRGSRGRRGGSGSVDQAGGGVDREWLISAVSWALSEGVGILSSERIAQTCIDRPFERPRRKLIQLLDRPNAGGASIAQGHPPAPPFSGSATPSSTALQTGQNSDRGSPSRFGRSSAVLKNRSRCWSLCTGSGVRAFPLQNFEIFETASAGRGRGSGRTGKLCVGVPYVN